MVISILLSSVQIFGVSRSERRGEERQRGRSDCPGHTKAPGRRGAIRVLTAAVLLGLLKPADRNDK